MRRELDELRNKLGELGVRFQEEQLPYGTKVTCPGGEVFAYYPKKGTVVVQGDTSTELSRDIEAWARADGPAERSEMVGPSEQIFIVYGHDTDARRDLQLLLHQMGFKPIVLGDLPAEGDTIIEKLEKYLGPNSPVGFACVLFTPDDEGYPKDRVDEKKYRARQNVILELGMVLTRLGRKRVVILRKGSVEKPSDIEGLIYLPFKERVDEAKSSLYKELTAAGYAPQVVT